MNKQNTTYQEFLEIGGEKKWQEFWKKEKIFEVKELSEKDKFYGLVEFPYASGDGLHTGHLRSYTAMDVICRKKRMQGKNVLYPMGFDNFGLPTENYAIKKGINPKIIDKENTKKFRQQLKEAGFSFDWSRAFATTDENYYKWTQWIFIQMYKNGLAYKSQETINWCTACKIGLANEEVVAGKCERCGGEVIKKEKEQWVLRITKYADRLIKDLDNVNYLDKIKTSQINWIGRSEGAEVSFQVKSEKLKTKNEEFEELKVFTTRPDTLFGVTFMVVAPEHELISNFQSSISNYDEVQKYIQQAKKKSDLERTDLAKEKTGVEIKGIKAINPVNNEEISIFVADYVMMNYGTGAIMAVPAHDERDWEFAKKYNIPIKVVIMNMGIVVKRTAKPPMTEEEIFELKASLASKMTDERPILGDGVNINSDFLNGLETEQAKQKIIEYLEEKGLGKKQIQYKLHDWIFSRQRYWGEPIPMVYCEKCGWNPIDEKDLPVVLPDIEDFVPTDEGDSPLAKAEDWVKTTCLVCGGEARRETDVMPNWAGSNWYFIRYCDPKNDKMMIDPEKAKYWLPVDWYNGGMEHTTLHLLYSRFVFKFLYDIGAVPKEVGNEPYAKRTAQGMILGAGGIKMSKSKGNVINPDDYVKKYGADTVRVYEMFMGPFDQSIAWDDKGVAGAHRFLEKVWKLKEKLKNRETEEQRNNKIENLLHKTIKKVSEDIENMRFNTAISQMMILVNEFEKQDSLLLTPYSLLLKLLSPFAPHLCEEIWQNLGHEKSIVFESWPEYDEKYLVEDEIKLAIQVNGKLRDEIVVPTDMSEDEIKAKALASEKIQKWLAGKEPKKVIYVKGKLVSLVV